MVKKPSFGYHTFFKTIVWMILLCLCLGGFHSLGRYYRHYEYPYGFNVYGIPMRETHFYFWFFFFGVATVFLCSKIVFEGSFGEIIVQFFRSLVVKTRQWPLFLCVTFFFFVLFLQHVLFGYAPIADDESTFSFIAKTLLSGRFVNPSPGDVAFFQNQFVVNDDISWFGKYPIGHPLLLAVGQLFQCERLIVPLVMSVSMYLVYWIGFHLFSRKIGFLACLFFLLSPQAVLTSATRLSQTTSCLVMLLVIVFLLRLKERPRKREVVLLFSLLGFGVFVRPFPGVFYIVVSVLYLSLSASLTFSRRIKFLIGGGIILSIWAGLFLYVNYQQTGHPLYSSYHRLHLGKTEIINSTSSIQLIQRLGVFRFDFPLIVSSFVSALLRQNIWLLGWPLSFLFLIFAGFDRKTMLLWMMIVGVYAYRIVVPKTVVSTTGPIYVLEAVPLLLLLTAYGVMRSIEWFRERGVKKADALICSILASCFFVSFTMFLPLQVRLLHKSSSAWNEPFRLLERHNVGRSIIFVHFFVPPYLGKTWSFFPPNPSPHLNDKYIFVRKQKGLGGAKKNIEFWKRRFPDRQAWFFERSKKGIVFRKIKKWNDFLMQSISAKSR